MQEILTNHQPRPYHDVGQQNFTKERCIGCPNIVYKETKMFDEMLKSMDHRECGCNESPKQKKCSTSCDVLWMIILLMVILKGGFFGLDLCTLIILFIVFGKDIMCKFKCNPCC